jgi:hypothetical protein
LQSSRDDLQWLTLNHTVRKKRELIAWIKEKFVQQLQFRDETEFSEIYFYEDDAILVTFQTKK